MKLFMLTENVDGKGEFDPITLYCSFCKNILMEPNIIYIECPETNKQKCRRGLREGSAVKITTIDSGLI